MKLQAAGLDACMENDCAAAANHTYGIALGIRVVVPADQYELALGVLSVGLWPVIISILLLGLPMMFCSSSYHCYGCAHHWK